jgi:hypothetical protein
MVWVRLPVYFYKRNDTFYFSRSIPSDLQHRFKKRDPSLLALDPLVKPAELVLAFIIDNVICYFVEGFDVPHADV